MVVDNINLAEKLKVFGLNVKEVEVYLTLVAYEWLTALQISRKCSVKRTTLYRILESLIAMGLIEEKIEDKTTLYAAAPGENLESLIREKEKNIQEMRQMLPELTTQIGVLNQVKPMEVSVRFFRGIKGLQYLNLKHTSARGGEVLIIDSNQWDKVLSREFAEEVRARNVKNKIVVREVTNHYDKEVAWTDNLEYLRNHYQVRVLPKKILDITQDIYIFNDTIQYTGYSRNDLVGIEIVSGEYAQMMKQMFEILWKVGTKK